MAKIIPEILSSKTIADPKRKAEIKIYNTLKSSLGDDWTIFYNISWLGKTHDENNPVDGEADFIAANPKKGVLVIEVKGGEISFEPKKQQWYSTDRYKQSFEIDPFNQATKSKHLLLRKIREFDSNNWVNIFHAVAFPDVYDDIRYDPNIQSPKEIIITGNDLNKIEYKLNKIFDFFQKEYKNSDNSLTIKALDIIIANPVRLKSPLSFQLNQEEEEFINLTEKQFSLLNTLNKQRKALIAGCAGSGKTFLAVEKAKRLANQGFKTLLTFFNKPLGDFLKKLTGDISNLDVLGFDELSIKMATEAGINFNDYTNNHSDMLIDSIKIVGKKYDAIIVDEGQDFAEDVWVALEECFNSLNPIFYIFYDDNQLLYHKSSSFPINSEPFELPDNVRNTKAIYEKALIFYKNTDDYIIPKALGPVGRTVEKSVYSSEKELINNLKSMLNRLIISEKIDPIDIVILTPKEIDKTILREIKIDGYKFTEDFYLNTNSNIKTIYYDSIYRFKGLERQLSIVIELDDNLLEQDNFKELCYVGLSRAKSHMILFGTNSFFDYMEKAQ